MDAVEISKRESPQVVSQEEMEYVVKQFIKEKKGVDVDINLRKGIEGHQFEGHFLPIQMGLLLEAFGTASHYFCQLDK